MNLLKLGTKPLWAVSEIKLGNVEEIVILDDDESVHQIWANKFRELGGQWATQTFST